MKTRRKFFSSIAAALSLPFLPKVLAKNVVADSPKDNVYTVPSVNTLIEKAMRVTQTLEPDTEKALARLNRMLERWAGESWQSEFDKELSSMAAGQGMTYSNGTLSHTKELTMAELEKTYAGLKFHKDAFALVSEPPFIGPVYDNSHSGIRNTCTKRT